MSDSKVVFKVGDVVRAVGDREYHDILYGEIINIFQDDDDRTWCVLKGDCHYEYAVVDINDLQLEVTEGGGVKYV